MDKPDIEYLNIPQKIKKKLYESNLNTVEKISTYYLEDLEFEEIELIQDEIFKYHVNDLGINNTEEDERPNSLIKNKIIANDFYSFSDVEHYCGNKEISDDSDNSESDFSDRSKISISSYSSSNSYHYKNSEKNVKENIKKFNNSILKSCTESWISKKEDVENEKKNYYCVENQLEKYFLIYSNFMKKQLKIRKTINTNCISLNKLLHNGIENSQIYFFYGNNAKMNKIILINLLYNFIYPFGNNNMSTHSVVYIYFSYIFDVTVIKNIISEKLNHEKKNPKQKSDFFNNFYILRIQNFNEIISFLLQLKKNYFTKNKSENDNRLNNITCIEEPQEINNTLTYNEAKIYKNINIDNEPYNKNTNYVSRKNNQYATTLQKNINNNQDYYSEQSSDLSSYNYYENEDQKYSEYELGNNIKIDDNNNNNIKDIEKSEPIKIPFSCSKHNKFDFIIEIKIVNKIRDRYIIRFTILKSRNNIKHSYSYCSIQKYVLTDLP
ncbi:hypothetical protein [Plasmodium yoelii yoelii]|uniref:Uncharacterized protein n=1 Tax=Plasmodium yoelii yoelii TaxID=73239 RepID=Q7RDC8_PLAYO|nr:hypothetical protein [Plasmodium yoelii yoelii]